VSYVSGYVCQDVGDGFSTYRAYQNMSAGTVRYEHICVLIFCGHKPLEIKNRANKTSTVGYCIVPYHTTPRTVLAKLCPDTLYLFSRNYVQYMLGKTPQKRCAFRETRSVLCCVYRESIECVASWDRLSKLSKEEKATIRNPRVKSTTGIIATENTKLQ
jgi:hypothetical protein